MGSIAALFIGVVVCGGVLMRQSAKTAAPVCRDCNVILVSLDTLSAAHLPCYGYHQQTAPNLCAFGTSNLLFTHAYANANYTLPTHVSMFTGLYPRHHGITGVDDTNLSPNLPFLPSLLKEHGYATIFVSDPNNVHMPRSRVYARDVDMFIDGREEKWAEALDTFAASVRNGQKTFLFLYSQYVHPPYRKADFPDALDSPYPWMFFDESDARLLTPVFLENVPYAIQRDLDNREYPDPSPYQTVLAELRRYSGDYQRQREVMQRHPDVARQYQQKYDPLIRVNMESKEELMYARSLYDRRIQSFDQGPLKELLAYVARPEIRKNTIVIITSDHGEEFGEHGAISHTTLYEPNTRVFFAMQLPDGTPRAIREYVQTVDIMPTIVGLLGISFAAPLDGISLVPALLGRTLPSRLLMAEAGNRITLRDRGWKLFVRIAEGKVVPIELYKTDTDPNEETNLLFSQMRRVRSMMKRYVEKMGEPRLTHER